MKNAQVRCWRVGTDEELFITYPEGDMGHRLICCTDCGEVHAVNVARQLYIEPDLEKHLKGVACSKCGNRLSGSWAYYPENFIDKDGRVRHFERPVQIPDEAESIIVEFPEVFSQQ